MNNPLLNKFETPFETVPFKEIKNEHFLPALKEAIEVGRGDIERIKNNREKPTFKNISEALDRAGHQVDVISMVFFNLHGAESSNELQNIAKEISPLLTEYSNDITLDEKLFQKVKAIYDQRDKLHLNPEEMTLVEKQHRSFTQSGALLGEAGKKKLREIDQKLADLKLRYSDNCLAETNAYQLIIEKEEELVGLPESIREMARQEAKERNEEGKWVFTLDYPSYGPFMTYSDNRSLRKKLFCAFGIRACQGNTYDNREILKQIAALRLERAHLLGYPTHAHLVLKERMAATPEKVNSFLCELLDHAKPVAQKEIRELEAFARQNGFTERLQKWDYAYWAEKLKKSRFDLDDERLRPYFKLENVIDGAFKVANKLYGIRFQERKDISVYHEDVKSYEVLSEQGQHIGIFYGDFFPRPGKRSGAWATSFRSQYKVDNKDVRPHASIVCNFTKPTISAPSLLTFTEVLTLFHEFGHSLHDLLSNCRYKALSATNVYWDFVELPSQIMENWAYEKECLDLFARHFETSEKIPQDWVTRIADSANFHEGRNTLRHLGLALLDMAWHWQSQNPSEVQDIYEFEQKACEKTELLPPVTGVMVSPSFTHIFPGGYSAGYYSYKWAEVLDADGFDLFKEKGLFNREVASKFRSEILEKGGSEHPMELYKRFRGREPRLKALLKRAGLWS